MLRSLSDKPLPGVTITLISETDRQYYSGMLSGYMEGIYTSEEISFDVNRIVEEAGVRFVKGVIESIDANRQAVTLTGGMTLSYDFLSLNLGSHTSRPEGFRGTTAKPFANIRELKQRLTDSDTPHPLLVVGSGASAVELALAAKVQNDTWHPVEVTLSLRRTLPLPGFSNKVRQIAKRALDDAGVSILRNSAVKSVKQTETGYSASTDKGELQFTEVLLATGVKPSPIRMEGFLLDEDGFITVTDTLQAVGHPNVVGVGDAIALSNHSLKKIGVYAVRQTPVLIENLHRLTQGLPLLRFQPQKHALQILSLGKKRGIFVYRGFHMTGRTAWRIKDRIDTRFMRG